MLPLGSLDLYYLGFQDVRGTFDQRTESERRHSVGSRLWGEAGNRDWNWEALYQFGSFGDGAIRAWTVASEPAYTWGDVRWLPPIALLANIASCDGDRDSDNLGNLHPQCPRGNYFRGRPDRHWVG